MSNYDAMAPMAMNDDAAFRSWGTSFHALLTAVGLVQTFRHRPDQLDNRHPPDDEHRRRVLGVALRRHAAGSLNSPIAPVSTSVTIATWWDD